MTARPRQSPSMPPIRAEGNCAAEKHSHQGFSQDLLDQARCGCAQRGANRGLMKPLPSTDHEKIRHIRAPDQKTKATAPKSR